tara:strand:+ start:1772 stop:2497 length:726 start_codon:yes stop_codon:yes gene_type:complete
MKNNISFSFKNKKVLILGGSKGIGYTISNEFEKSGACVYVASRKNHKDFYNHIQCDVLNITEINNVYNEIIIKEEKIDIVVNCVGTNLCEKIEHITEDEWDRLEKINLKSYFFSCKEAIKQMKKQKSGVIVNISSIAGRHRSLVSGAHYVASKAGIIGLTKQLAFEVAKYGIRINVLCPSQTMTDMLKNSMTKSEIDELSKDIPLGRIASTYEQASPVLFLCSNESSYITGAVLDVNGGQL